MLDTEFVDGVYYIFDIMLFNGKDIREEKFHTRYKHVEKNYISLKTINRFKLKISDFANKVNLEIMQRKCIRNIIHIILMVLIFTPIDGKYDDISYKWKPREECTADFLIKHDGDIEGGKIRVDLYVGQVKTRIPDTSTIEYDKI